MGIAAEGLDYVKLEELLVEETWLEALPGELQKPYAKNLCRFVEREVRGSVPIYPPPYRIFNALHSTPFDRVKAVIIGQVYSSPLIKFLRAQVILRKNLSCMFFCKWEQIWFMFSGWAEIVKV